MVGKLRGREGRDFRLRFYPSALFKLSVVQALDHIGNRSSIFI
jgi:hypothetical protein